MPRPKRSLIAVALFAVINAWPIHHREPAKAVLVLNRQQRRARPGSMSL